MSEVAESTGIAALDDQGEQLRVRHGWIVIKCLPDELKIRIENGGARFPLNTGLSQHSFNGGMM